jgi:hypothetical protein
LSSWLAVTAKQTVAAVNKFTTFEWMPWFAAGVATLLACLLYTWSAAPGLSWAHQGADGGELLAAAMTNGVPHPPGYPLYMLLLQGWLGVGRWLFPHSNLARLGSLLSVTCAALSVGVTVWVAHHLTLNVGWRWVWALVAGLAWAISPLLWSQALITEVYALHALLISLLGWAVLVRSGRPLWLVLVVACGVAHHLTFVLLLPAVFYYLWAQEGGGIQRLWRIGGHLSIGGLLGGLFYLRTPLVASIGVPSPINWGYADNWEGFWWLVSGAAYRGYLFSESAGAALGRVAGWAATLTTQYTVVGMAIAFVGLAAWDQRSPALRNWSFAWLAPVSIYMIGYYTRDSDIYLLAVAWLIALWLAVGLAESLRWLRRQWPKALWQWWLIGVLVGGLIVLIVLRWPALALGKDEQARRFLQGAARVLEPDSLVISLADNETFALWYGVWGSQELVERAPGVIPINYSLYQFPWYRRLLYALYPDVVGESQSMDELLRANQGRRPIFFSEQLEYVPAESLTPIYPLWRYTD